VFVRARGVIAMKAREREAMARLLVRFADREAAPGCYRARRTTRAADPAAIEELVAADLLTRRPGGDVSLTDAGRAFLARAALARGEPEIDAYLAQHLALGRVTIDSAVGRRAVTVDEAESPLAWLARRKGKNGRAMIEPDQLLAGERLRADFTRAQLMPRVTSNWSAAVAEGARSGDGGASAMTDMIVAARQRVRRALNGVGPEFAGLLVDVCCFLKGLEDIERERGWPARSGKVVLQLGLDRLARHYGLAAEARGRPRAPTRSWTAQDACAREELSGAEAST
jgi:hypothetical protein